MRLFLGWELGELCQWCRGLGDDARTRPDDGANPSGMMTWACGGLGRVNRLFQGLDRPVYLGSSGQIYLKEEVGRAVKQAMRRVGM